MVAACTLDVAKETFWVFCPKPTRSLALKAPGRKLQVFWGPLFSSEHLRDEMGGYDIGEHEVGDKSRFTVISGSDAFIVICRGFKMHSKRCAMQERPFAVAPTDFDRVLILSANVKSELGLSEKTKFVSWIGVVVLYVIAEVCF